jgi:16S rRNA A1518/A1519 N6-dimethyltransferase RsmA/KsgA/DIM1 with predicted DNA glycosylase/AP lyase activity
VVRLETIRPDYGLKDEKLFFDIVKASFARAQDPCERPDAALRQRLSKEEVSGLLTGLGFDERVRGETLGIGDFVSIANALSSNNRCFAYANGRHYSRRPMRFILRSKTKLSSLSHFTK